MNRSPEEWIGVNVTTSLLRVALSGRGRWAPSWLVHAIGAAAADLTWWRRGTSVAQLEETLARVEPGASRARVRALSRAGMRSYLRYWCGLVTVPRLGPEALETSVHARGLQPLADELAAGRGAVVALGHLGSWDHVGTWAATTLAPVTTVAERLGSPGLFEAFTDARARAGITALPLDDASTPAALRRALKEGHAVALLADRDLTGSGIEVELLGSRARFAPGPATLAVTGGARLFFAGCTYRRRPTPWWTLSPWRRWVLDLEVTEVSAAVPDAAVPDGAAVGGTSVGGIAAGGTRRAARAAAVASATQACADALGAVVREHPQDWHVLQPVFLDEEAAVALRAPSQQAPP